jgi:glyoxylate/hydroxypyruvate reductase A
MTQEAILPLLVIDLDKHIGNARAWRYTFREQLPDLDIRIWPEAGNIADVEYLAFMHPDFDALQTFPNLKAMFSRSAGVESFVRHPKLPKAPPCKVDPPGGDPMMIEYVVMHVLRFHLDISGDAAAHARKEWRRITTVRPEQRTGGFLGFGNMAKVSRCTKRVFLNLCDARSDNTAVTDAGQFSAGAAHLLHH